MQQTQTQGKFSAIQQDITKLENLYLKDDLYPQDFLITRTLRKQVITKPCSYHFQSSNVDSFLKETGTLKKVLPSLSLIGGFMLLSLIVFLAIGLSLGLEITATVATVVLFGLPLRLMSNLSYIENYMFLKSLPQIWQI